VPTGIHEGTVSIGYFDAATQYFQTKHHRPIIGAYLSRVSPRIREEYMRSPVLDALFTLSQNTELTPELREQARASREAFLRKACVRFVMVNKRHASSSLQAFAVQTLDLRLVHEDAGHALFTPANPPACDPSTSQRAAARATG
jgi:hypothetical protein